MRVVLTGATSFIGRHVAPRLATAGHAVTATSRGPAKDGEWIALDLSDAASFAKLPRQTDAIVHIAGISAMPGVTTDDMLACNVAGAANLLHYAKECGAGAIIYASTLSVHGAIAEPVVDETTPIRDPDLYGASKYRAEQIFAAGDVPCIALRLPGVLGPGAHRAWIPVLRERITRDEEVTIYNPDAPFNNALHVDDLGDFILSLLGQKLEGFVAMPLAAAASMTIRAAVESLAKGLGKNATIRVGMARRGGFTVSSERAIAAYGYRPAAIETIIARYAAGPA